ncbi:hypothetical protein GDO78_015811 [Eleutherodactylus coqui]|uniref:Uncharacterized protein n=1 Tax=Eleutherodactylus coqui TaxID=57060 RepID=A0A8J6ED92_ELECQ|nr:hypothetical protein GDO78_015811 [Eleutherodactylus coqui]
MVVKKTTEECAADSWAQDPITVSSPHSPMHKEILELTNKITELLTGEVSAAGDGADRRGERCWGWC